MQFDTTSKYATGGIDDLIFFQDANIGNHEELAEYEELFKNKSYSQAIAYLTNSSLYPYDASLLNMIENRLRAIEEHIDEYVDEKIEITFYKKQEPKHKISYEANSCVGPNNVSDVDDMHDSTYGDLSYYTHNTLSKYNHGDFT